jgi:hypothetical protein
MDDGHRGLDDQTLADMAAQFDNPPGPTDVNGATGWRYMRYTRYNGTSGVGFDDTTKFCLNELTPPATLNCPRPGAFGEQRCAFAAAMVKNALCGAWPESLQLTQIQRLGDMLRCAVEARDAEVASVVWMKLDKLNQEAFADAHEPDDEDRSGLEMHQMKFTHDLLSWLLFYVRQPKLLLCMIHDRERYLVRMEKGKGIVSAGHNDWRPVNGPINPSAEATAMVAAVMDAVLSVKHDILCCDGMFNLAQDLEVRAQNMSKLPRDTEAYWQRLLTKLYTCLPFYPIQLRLSVSGTGPRPTFESALLQVAVRCSELSCDPLKAMLAQCLFSPKDQAAAFETAIRPGVLRGGTVLEAAKLIVADMACRRSIVTDEVLKAKEAMWLSVLRSASWMNVAALSTAQAKEVEIPSAVHPHDHHPEVFLALLDNLASVEPAHRLERIMRSTFSTVFAVPSSGDGRKTYLLQRMLKLWHERIDAPILHYLMIDGFLETILTQHYRAFDQVEPHVTKPRPDGSLVALPEHSKKLFKALTPLIELRMRDATRRVVKLFDHFPQDLFKDYDFMRLFICNFCKRPWEEPQKTAKILGQGVVAKYNEQVAEDFRCFLDRGKFHASDLSKGLKLASRRECAVAVEVLVSPPYNAKHDPDDAFVANVLTVLLAPEGSAFKEAERNFEEKRPLLAPAGEGGEEEGEEEEAQKRQKLAHEGEEGEAE